MSEMSSRQSNLASSLHNLDGRSYGNLKQIRGRYTFGPVTVFIDRVQADPFASPSKVRVRVDRADAKFPLDLTTDRADRIAAADYLLRAGNEVLAKLDQRALILGHPGQEILERTNILLDEAGFEARLLVNLPARGRRILGHQAADILTRDLPEFAERLFLFDRWSDAQQAEEGTLPPHQPRGLPTTSNCTGISWNCAATSARQDSSDSSATVRSSRGRPGIRTGR
jgi:predicted ABC-class ATPase